MIPQLQRLVFLLRLGRPLFLAGGFLLHGLGVAMALYEGARLNLVVLLWGQLAITGIQVMTHYGNEYFDLAADQANPTPTRWSGGSRMLAEGYVAPSWALRVALGAGAVGLLATLILVFRLPVASGALPLLLLAWVLAWEYSAPPLRLHSRGLGELTGAVLITGLTPLVGYYLQAGRLSLLPFLAIVPLGIFQFVMLMLIEFPDADGDAAVGKDTLVVRLGGARAARLVQIALVAFYLLLPLLVNAGLPGRVALSVGLFAAPGVAWLLWRLQEGAWAERRWWSWLGFVGVALVVGATAVEFVAFVSLV